MIEKILSEIQKLILQNEEGANACYPSAMARESAYYECKEIVQEAAKEYGTASDNDVAVVSALPSLYPLQKFEEEVIHKVVASAKGNGWIPVETELPKESGLEHYEITFLSSITKTPVRSVAIFSKGRWYMAGTNGRDCDMFPFEVIAWKEQSAPYQKGE